MTIVTLTYELGSGEDELESALSLRLGFKKNEAISMAESIGRSLDVSASFIVDFMNNRLSIRERNTVDPVRLSQCIAHEVLIRASRGNAILKGWNAARILDGAPQVVKVKVQSRLEQRANNLLERYNRVAWDRAAPLGRLPEFARKKMLLDFDDVITEISRADEAVEKIASVFANYGNKLVVDHDVIIDTSLCSIMDGVEIITEFIKKNY